MSLPSSPETTVDPCEACRKALARCVLDQDSSCVPCKASGAECSLIRSPQLKKRKLDDDSSEESAGRRRWVDKGEMKEEEKEEEEEEEAE